MSVTANSGMPTPIGHLGASILGRQFMARLDSILPASSSEKVILATFKW
jgi:hypothetical protein